MANQTDDSKKQPSPEGHKLEGHSYDGIDELDNSLPRWWLWSFYLTIIFAIGYFAYYSLGNGPTLVKEYEDAKGEYDVAQSVKKESVKIASEDELKAFLKDPARIKSGHDIFQSKCLACHGAQGQGGIGANLTDDYWLHGGKLSEILKTVTNGVLDKGMPPWGQVLKQDELYSVAVFVKSLRGSNPPGAKPAQGELVKE